MQMILAMSFILHFMIIGVVLGFFGDRALRPKIIAGVFAYFFGAHLAAGYALRNNLDAFDPRTEDYKKWREEVKRSNEAWKPSHYDYYDE